MIVQNPTPQQKPSAGAAKQLSLTDVQSVVQGSLAPARAASARVRYIAAKMADLPAIYQQQLVSSESVDELSDSEQAIRSQFIQDRKAFFDRGAGLKPGDASALLAGKVPSDQDAADAAALSVPGIDTSGMSASQLIEAGLQQQATNQKFDGPKDKDIAGPAGGHGSPDLSRMSGSQLMLLGLQQAGSSPRRVGGQ